jgi:WD40 repeat protein
MGTRFPLGLALLAAGPAVWAGDPKPAHTLRPPGDVTWVAFTPDSKHLLTGSDASPKVRGETTSELRLWSVETGRLESGPVTATGIGASGAVSPDGKLAVTGGFGGDWQLWKLPDLTPASGGSAGKGRVDRLAFRPDGKAFAALLIQPLGGAGQRYTAVTIDVATGKPVRGAAYWPAERPRGQPASARTDGPPAGWPVGHTPPFDGNGVADRPEGRAADPLEVPGDDENCGGPMARAISGDGKVAVSSGCNGQVVVWGYPARKVIGKPLAAYPRLAVSDPGLSLSADGRRAAVASMTEHGTKGHLLALTVYDVDARAIVAGPLDLGTLGVGLVGALAFSPDGSVVAIAFDRRGPSDEKPTTEIQLWRVPGKK